MRTPPMMTGTFHRPEVDQWAAEHPTGPMQRMSRDELGEASMRLSELGALVGPLPTEVTALLVSLLHERDATSLRILNWLRFLDEVARA